MEGDGSLIVLQARRYYQKIAGEMGEDEQLAVLSEIEANRDVLLARATDGALPLPSETPAS